MNLTAPSRLIFLVSILLAIAVLLVRYAGVNVPVVSDNTTIAMLIAYLVLVVGVVFPGI